MKKKFVLPLVLLLLMCAGAVFAGNGTSVEYVEGEVLVVLEIPSAITTADTKSFETALSTSANTVAASVGAQVMQTYGAIASSSGKNIMHLKGEGKTTSQLIADLQGVPGVLGVSPNYVRHVMLTPNDPRYSELWGMDMIGAPSAWDLTTGSNAVYVAVIDTGIRYDHVDLSANMGTDRDGNNGIDTVNGDTDPMDDHGHGTHVAGTIGATGNNATGVTGVNWTVKLLGVKVLDAAGSGTDAAIIAGLNYVVNQKNRGLNIRVANMSLGGWSYPIANPNTDAYALAHKAVSDAGILLAVAAGNESQDIDNPTWYYHPVRGWENLTGLLCYPACFQYDNMITVGSITSTRSLSSFSNYSPNYVHLAAPGSDILSTTFDGLYDLDSGTSMAAPHVAGAAALIAAYRTSETASQIKARILDNVTANSNLTGKVSTNGHLNLSAAISATPPTPTVPVTGVTIAPLAISLAVNANGTLTATVVPNNASTPALTWASSNPAVATVTALPAAAGEIAVTRSATVTGVSAGVATITATTTDGTNITATSTITVGGGSGSSGGGCTVGAGATIPAVLLLMVPLAMLLKRK